MGKVRGNDSNSVTELKTNRQKMLYTKLNLFRLLFICTLFLATLGISGFCLAQSSPARTLLALSKTDHILAVIDPVSFKELARIPVGPDPHEVIASADGKTAFVTIYGGGRLHELDVLDLVALKPIINYDTAPLMGPHGLTFANGKAWFTAEGTKTVASFDPTTNKVDWVMGTGQDRTHMVYVTDDGKKVYTTNVASGTVSILTDTLIQPGSFGPPGQKPHHDWVHNLIPVSQGSEGFDVSPDGKELWTAAANDGTIAVIDLVNKKLSAKFNAKAMGANRLKFTPDGKRVLVTSLWTGDLFFYDAGTHKEIKRINTGRSAAGILVDTDGSRAFIGCTGDNYIAIIDLKTMDASDGTKPVHQHLRMICVADGF